MIGELKFQIQKVYYYSGQISQIRMGPCLSNKVEASRKSQFLYDKEVSHPESRVKSVMPLSTTLFNILRRQSQVEVIHAQTSASILRNSQHVDAKTFITKDTKVLYNFKNVVVIGSSEACVKLGEEASPKNVYFLKQNDAEYFVKKFPIYGKKARKTISVSSIPVLVFSENELIMYDKNSKDTFQTIFVHSKKYEDKKVYEELGITHVIESQNYDDKEKQIRYFIHELQKLSPQQQSILLLYGNSLKQQDLRKIISKYLKTRYNVSEHGAQQYLRNSLPADGGNEEASQSDPFRATVYNNQDKRRVSNEQNRGFSKPESNKNKYNTEKMIADPEAKKQQNKDSQQVSQSAIRRLQTPNNKIQLNDSTKPYYKALRQLKKEASAEVVDRAYSISILLVSNIYGNPSNDAAYRKVKTTNKNISQITRYRSGVKLMELLGWVQNGDKEGNWVNNLEGRYLKIFRTDLDLAYRVFQQQNPK